MSRPFAYIPTFMPYEGQWRRSYQSFLRRKETKATDVCRC